ncbi:hypothetical protein F0562_026779 [Nyssa sinensis]|uniref:Uncharacterized protein n=1 Tax=Nyssa sinensis TaxID=561372 RepID=A0A5J5BEH9_9ASTE|nr:hypothetical protein F0562_026779 [Nyssa sinensis]
MAATSKSLLRFISVLILVTTLFFPTSVAEIRSTEIRSDARSTIPFDEFGFTHSGRLDLNVSQISLSKPNPNVQIDTTQVGFFLCTLDSWFHVLEQIQEGDITCSLQSNLIKSIFTFDQLNGNNRFDISFKVTDSNQVTLLFGNCVPDLQISMNVHSAMYNFDPKSGRRDYLSADKEKKVLMIVIPLQVVANVAQVVLDETGPYGQDSFTWKQVFLLVDVICCCAVLFPIVWSIKNLREAARTDGKAAVNLMKLTLFRQYYIVVICYIYFTRVVVYALETITSYRYQWTSVVAAELATLAFYVFTGYNFRPTVHNPYFALDDEEEEAAAEALKLEDEFEL